MKKVSMLLISGFLILCVSGFANAGVYDEQIATIHQMANYLVENQNDDGSWDWTQPEAGDTDPTNSSPPNTAGATARGLIAAYNRTGNVDYLDSAVKAGKFIIDNATTEVGAHKDSLFLNELDQAMVKAGLDNTYGGKTFYQYAADKVSTAVSIFESGTYTSNTNGNTYTWDASGNFGSDLINAFNIFRGTGTDYWAGLVPWEAGEWAQALFEVDASLYGAKASDLADTLFTATIGSDGIFNTGDDGYVGSAGDPWVSGLGLSGLLEGMATVGSDQADIDKVVSQLSSMGTYGDFQNAGYYALAMELAGEKAFAIGAGLDIFNVYKTYGLTNGYTDNNGNPIIYTEALGEALHGLSNNPVPEPATLALFGIGLLGLAGVSRKKS